MSGTDRIQQQVQQVCTQEPVVSPALKGWINSKVVYPVSVAQDEVDEIQRTGNIDQLCKVQFELNKVKESCQRLNERSDTHEEGMLQLKRQREADCAHFTVETAIIKARHRYEMDDVLKRLDLLESESDIANETEERKQRRKHPEKVGDSWKKQHYGPQQRSRMDSGVSVTSIKSQPRDND